MKIDGVEVLADVTVISVTGRAVVVVFPTVAVETVFAVVLSVDVE